MRTRYVIGVRDGVGIRAVTKESVKRRLRDKTNGGADLTGDVQQARLYRDEEKAWLDYFAGGFNPYFRVIRVLLEA
jgi:hypothetical protein